MNKALLSTAIISAVIALGIGFYVGNAKVNYNAKLETATVLAHPRDIDKFDLTDNLDKKFDNESLKGHWTLLFFGFTNCPHICPMTMAELKKAYEIMQQQKIPTPQVVLISIDPARDTIARLNTYVQGFNPHFMGATGSEVKIKNLTQNLHVLYMKVMKTMNKNQNKGNTKENYDIDHSGSIFLINPQGQWSAIFSMPHKAKQIAHDVGLIQKYA